MLKHLAASRVVAIAGGILAVFIGTLFASWPPEKPAAAVTLVYVGAENCAPCDIWERKQGGEFRESSEFRRLAYREVKSPSLFDVLDDRNWPEDLRVYRQAIGQRAGVPLWLVIADNRIVMQGSGLSQWKEAVLPKIKSLLH